MPRTNVKKWIRVTSSPLNVQFSDVEWGRSEYADGPLFWTSCKIFARLRTSPKIFGYGRVVFENSDTPREEISRLWVRKLEVGTYTNAWVKQFRLERKRKPKGWFTYSWIYIFVQLIRKYSDSLNSANMTNFLGAESIRRRIFFRINTWERLRYP